MQLPFSTAEFMHIFSQYNGAFPFMPFITYAAGVISLWTISRKADGGSRIVFSILGLFWIWNGALYHLTWFRRINQAAALFGILFILQGLLFLVQGVKKNSLRLEFSCTLQGGTALLLITYAMILYPAAGYLVGHIYPESPVFGMAPCPTTIYTFGILLLVRGKVPVHLLVIPFIWSIIGLGAAVSLGVYEDFGLTIASLLGTIMIITHNRIAGSAATRRRISPRVHPGLSGGHSEREQRLRVNPAGSDNGTR